MLPGTFGEQTVSVYLITFKVKLKSCPNHVSSDLIKRHHTYCTALLIINQVNSRQKMSLFFPSKASNQWKTLKKIKKIQKKTSTVWFLLEWSTLQYASSLSSVFLIPIGMHVKWEGLGSSLPWQNTFPKFSKYCPVFASMWQSLGLTGIRLLNPHRNTLEIRGWLYTFNFHSDPLQQTGREWIWAVFLWFTEVSSAR